MAYIHPEVIAEARKVDLFSYLQATDPNELVKCDGNEYCTRTHDSLKISNGKWFWWSRGIGGRSAVDYLMDDKNDYINWWLYNLSDEYNVSLSDGSKTWNLKNPEALYDFLINDCK